MKTETQLLELGIRVDTHDWDFSADSSIDERLDIETMVWDQLCELPDEKLTQVVGELLLRQNLAHQPHVQGEFDTLVSEIENSVDNQVRKICDIKGTGHNCRVYLEEHGWR